MKRLLLGAVCAVSAAATAASAAVVTYDASPAGGPPVGVDAFNAAANPVGGGGTVVDLGGGNHALSLTIGAVTPNFIPFGRLGFGFNTWEGMTRYEWRIDSFDVFVGQDTSFDLLVFPIRTGTLQANSWTTVSFGADGARFYSALFRQAAGGPINSVLIDNVNYSFIRSVTVPEPSTWAMLIAGFGLIGASLRRRNFARAAQ